MLTGLTTPGAKSSEFLATVLNVIAQIVLAFADVISSGTATKLGALGTIAYIVSRGLAKYETKPGPAQPVVPPQPPVA